MTIQELEQYKVLKEWEYDILKEISTLNKKKKEYEPSLIASGIGGLPSGNSISRPTENIALSVIEYEKTISERIKRLDDKYKETVRKTKRVEKYIDSIPDEFIQGIFYKKYILDRSWRQIAIEYNYSPNSFRKFQDIVKNYL